VRAGCGHRPGHNSDPSGDATWRVLSDVAQDGPRNMALDEAIAYAVEARRVPPTVRFYAWDKPTVSLGCLQAARGAVEREACDRLGVRIVRRPTGGRAVLHDDELTYSVCVPLDGAWARLSVGESFRRIGEGLVAGLRRLGIAATLGKACDDRAVSGEAQACFLTPRMPAVLAEGKKLVGSAQRRLGGAILQHGSLLVGVNLAMHQAVFPGWPREGPCTVVTWLKALVREVPTRSAIERALMDGWAAALSIRGAAGELTAWERREAERLAVTRYATPAWTWRR
jgi:lipoate-protein ligase A